MSSKTKRSSKSRKSTGQINTPEDVLKAFFISQSNAESALSLWMDSLGLIDSEKEYVSIRDFDRDKGIIQIKVVRVL